MKKSLIKLGSAGLLVGVIVTSIAIINVQAMESLLRAAPLLVASAALLMAGLLMETKS